MTRGISVAALRHRPELCAFFAGAFKSEWPSWYGPGGQGDAEVDLRVFANSRGELPVGVVALGPKGDPLGVAALKAFSIASHAHLAPWAAAGYVIPAYRRQGIGAVLLSALRDEAARLRLRSMYCATSTSASLLAREGWQLIDSLVHDGQPLKIFRREVAPGAG